MVIDIPEHASKALFQCVNPSPDAGRCNFVKQGSYHVVSTGNGMETTWEWFDLSPLVPPGHILQRAAPPSLHSKVRTSRLGSRRANTERLPIRFSAIGKAYTNPLFYQYQHRVGEEAIRISLLRDTMVFVNQRERDLCRAYLLGNNLIRCYATSGARKRDYFLPFCEKSRWRMQRVKHPNRTERSNTEKMSEINPITSQWNRLWWFQKWS